MVDLKRNHQLWNDAEHWETGKFGNGVPLADGEKWSRGWGDSKSQWAITILPRILQFFPADICLEIGCGHGRWSQYLIDHAGTVILLDYSEHCVEYCRSRFGECSRLGYLTNDGQTLDDIRTESIDFVFSFDSLVHVDSDVIASYLPEIDRVLTPKGAAFIHHSNLAACDTDFIENSHLRDPTVSAELVRDICRPLDIYPSRQELVPWGALGSNVRTYTDCFTTIRKGNGDTEILERPEFYMEKCTARELWASSGGKPPSGRRKPG